MEKGSRWVVWGTKRLDGLRLDSARIGVSGEVGLDLDFGVARTAQTKINIHNDIPSSIS